VILRFIGIVFVCCFSSKKTRSFKHVRLAAVVHEAVAAGVSLSGLVLLNCVGGTFQLEAGFLLSWSVTAKIGNPLCFL